MNAFERFFAKLGKAIIWPFKNGAKVIEVLTTGLKDEPEVQTAIVGLVKKIQEVSEDSVVAIAARGLDVPDDIQTVTDAKALWLYVMQTFLPAVEGAYKDLATDVAVVPAAVPAPVSGLASITPA